MKSRKSDKRLKTAYMHLCKIIGCSGIDDRCPGDINCNIIHKIVKYNKPIQEIRMFTK